MAADGSQSAEQVKAACRHGVPEQHRRALWLSLAGVSSDATQDYMRACAQVFGTHAPLPDKLLSVRVNFRTCLPFAALTEK